MKIAECVESLSVPVVGLYIIYKIIYIYNYICIYMFVSELVCFSCPGWFKNKSTTNVTRVDHVYRIRV